MNPYWQFEKEKIFLSGNNSFLLRVFCKPLSIFKMFQRRITRGDYENTLVFDGDNFAGISVGSGVSGTPINAENNWWGDSSGPSGIGSGSGDSVSENVDYNPWSVRSYYYDFCGDEDHPFPTGDVSGPDGTKDCIVNFFDFTVMAENWLTDNNPVF